MIYRFLDKKSTGSARNPNQQLSNELHKRITRKFKKRSVYLSFKDNIWSADLADSKKKLVFIMCNGHFL